MKENTQEKLLVQVNKKSIFYKIKSSFKNLFHKNIEIEKNNINEKNTDNNIKIEEKKSEFLESIKNIENEETKLLELQKQYRNGEIKEENLTEEQKKTICALYDKQIESLRKSNEYRKQKLLENRKRLQTDS